MCKTQTCSYPIKQIFIAICFKYCEYLTKTCYFCKHEYKELNVVKPAQRLKVSILRRPALVFIIFFILNILWAGFSAKPYGISDLADLAKSPFVSHAKYDYILESPLFFIAAHPFTALKSGYMLFCLLVLASAYFAFFYKLKQYREYKLRILLGLLFLAHPVSYILLNWIGMEDSLTVLSTVFILFSASPVVICIVSAIAMFNHAQALFIVPSLLMLRHMAHAEEIKNKHITAGLIGIVLGKILSMVFLSVTTVTAQPRWNLVFSESLGYWLKINASYFPLELYSFNFSLWLIIVLSIFYFRKNNTS